MTHSWAFDRPITSPFAQPRGWRGRLAGWAMQLHNRRTCREVADGLSLRARQDVLEIGFGPGVLLGLLAERPEALRLTGVDPSPVMLAQARRRVPLAELRAGTAAATGLPDSAVDHAVSVHTVALWPDLDAGLDELHRVLRPGGTLSLTWHSATARSRTSRSMGLPADAVRRLDEALHHRFDAVARAELTDDVLFTGVKGR